MELNFDAVYYEPEALGYELGRELKEKFRASPWNEIVSHNRIREFSAAANSEFPVLKRHLIISVRKTHRYVANHKISDWLVPYTSSGCRAACL
jgi:spore photoproduct lyase